MIEIDYRVTRDGMGGWDIYLRKLGWEWVGNSHSFAIADRVGKQMVNEIKPARAA